MIQIRKATSSDFKYILLLGDYFNHTPYMIDQEFRRHTQIKIPLLLALHASNSSIKILVAEKNSEIIGFISYSFENLLSTTFKENPKCASIFFLSVHPMYQNQKIGSQLLARCLDACDKEKIDILRIGVDYSNHIAQHLYQKYHFKPVFDFYIYRIYRDRLPYSNNTLIPIINNTSYSSYNSKLIVNAIKKRPLHWLYEHNIRHNQLITLLNQQNKRLLQKHILELIQFQDTFGNVVGFLLRQDVRRQKHYQLTENIWQISDLFYSDLHHTSVAVSLLQNTLLSLPNFLMAEYSIHSDDNSTKMILEQTGMHRVYHGQSLSYHF